MIGDRGFGCACASTFHTIQRHCAGPHVHQTSSSPALWLVCTERPRRGCAAHLQRYTGEITATPFDGPTVSRLLVPSRASTRCPSREAAGPTAPPLTTRNHTVIDAGPWETAPLSVPYRLEMANTSPSRTSRPTALSATMAPTHPCGLSVGDAGGGALTRRCSAAILLIAGSFSDVSCCLMLATAAHSSSRRLNGSTQGSVGE